MSNLTINSSSASTLLPPPFVTTESVNQSMVVQPTEPASETQMIEVLCDLCAETMHATKANLQRYGWGIYKNCCFCPFHEEEI